MEPKASVRRGSWLVRILTFWAETAGGDQHTLGRADVDDSAAVRTIEAMIDAGLNADDAAFIVDDQVIDDGSQLNLDAEFFAFCEHRMMKPAPVFSITAWLRGTEWPP